MIRRAICHGVAVGGLLGSPLALGWLGVALAGLWLMLIATRIKVRYN